MKRFICFLMCVIMFSGTASAVSAKSAVVIDSDTLEVLFEKNSEQILTMASTTKIMTALVALENADISKEITVLKEYTLVEGSSMYLTEGEVLTMNDLLYGLMLMSGNDAAIAIANETTGDYDEFIELMNNKAKELGLQNTSFTNPNGLDEENHYTTATDLAVITANALKNDKFLEIVSSKYYKNETRTMKNHNKLLWLDENTVGVKTGFTKKSGRCLVSAMEKDGKILVAVTLDAPSDWSDHQVMYENSFSAYERYNLHTVGEEFGKVAITSGDKSEISVTYANDANITLTKKQKDNMEILVNAKKITYAPVKKGEIYGEIVYTINNIEIFSDNLIYSEDVSYEYVKALNIVEKFWDFLKNLFY